MGKQLDQAQIWEHWPTLAGSPLWMHGKPKKFRDLTLYIEADSPVWAHRFTYRKWAIIKRINGHVGYELVSDLFVKLSAEKSEDEPQDDA